MGIYVIAPCLLKGIREKLYLTEVLIPFTQQNSLKIGIDSQNKILNKYSEIGQMNPGIASWLHLMSYEPSSFEKIDIPNELSDPEDLKFYLKVCKCVVQQKKLIVFSHQSLDGYPFQEGNLIEFEGTHLFVFDRDEAIVELSMKGNNITINDAIIATNGSTITRVRK